MNQTEPIESIYPDLDDSTDSVENLYLVRLAGLYGEGLLDEYLETIEKDGSIEEDLETVNSESARISP